MVLVSVLLPVFNERPERLLKALQSISRQTFLPFETIIIDDSTLEATRSCLQSWTKKNPKAKIISPQIRKNLASALNQGLDVANGKYIARADSDDIQEPVRLSRQFEFLEKHSNIGAAGAAVKLIDEKENYFGIKSFPADSRAIKRQLCVNNPISHATVMFRKQCVKQFGGYHEEFAAAEDYEMWLRWRNQGVEFANLEIPLVLYRIPNTVRRDRVNWKYNLLAKVKHFRQKDMLKNLCGLALVSLAWFSPPKMLAPFYRHFVATQTRH